MSAGRLPSDAVLLDDDLLLDAAQFARSCGTTTEFIAELVLEGVLPARTDAFSGADVVRVRKLLRVQRDFDASLPGAAVIVELLEEVERLRAALRR